MGLFDRKQSNPGPAPPPVPSTSQYSVDTINRLLDEIGKLRPNVQRASMKLLVSRVAWETPKYISQKSAANGGQLPGPEVSGLQEQLLMIQGVLTKYIEIERSPEKYGNQAGVLLRQGVTSLRSYVERIEAAGNSGSVDLIGFNVDTKILSTHQF